ncbi:MAG: beta-ketoacyl-ACP synthase III [Lachnospiraceae bacterium]|nr:beta-ketoacyl-ACP synthase III [Lachnospiraceae bacterium]
MNIKICGTGSALPEKVITNKDLEKMVDTEDSWIVDRTGISQRHVASDEENVASLGTLAAKRALEMSNMTIADIDMILVATCSDDDRLPNCACMIQKGLGGTTVPAFDINSACTGFLTALTITDAYFNSGMYKRILVVGTETLSRIVDYTDRGTCILFGDGAGAAVLEAVESDTRMVSSLFANGEKGDALTCTAAGKVLMDGQGVYKFATRCVPQVINDVLSKAALTTDDIDLFVLHQANKRIIDSIARTLKSDINKFPMNIANVGNMSSASIPVLLDEINRKKLIKKGDKIVLSGFGAGLTYGACIITWE